MIRLCGRARDVTAVAVSGGVDSMAALSFLHQSNPNITAAHFHHGTEHGKEAHAFVASYCHKHNIRLIVGRLTQEKPDEKSWEEHWRDCRYAFLHGLDHTIATAHHLDDVAETYLWSSLHGHARFIHYRQPGPDGATNIVRPFLLTPKSEMRSWCERHGIPWIEDPSNLDHNHPRNRIRHVIMPEILKVNPGFLNVVSRMARKSIEERKDA